MRMRELREQLRRVDELRMPDVWSEARRRVVSSGLREDPLRDGPSSVRRGAAALVALVVFAAGGTLLWRAIQPAPDLRGPSPSPEPATDALSELAPGWTQLAPPPDYRCCAGTAWTGSELLVWSGYTYTGYSNEVAKRDGFRFDPISGRTTPMALSPLGPRSAPASAWTGRELLVWGGQDPGGPPYYDDGAAYDPATDTWRLLPPSPLSARVPLSVWTGFEWILWGTAVRRDDRPLDGAAYDPANNTWRSIAPGPIELTDATATWTGTEMIVFGAALHGGNQPESPTAIAAAYDPRADTWRTLPPSPLDTNSNTAVWNGSELVALDYNHASAAYDPRTDMWLDLGRVPGDDCEGGLSGSVAIDGDVLAIDCGEGLLFRKGSDGWVDVTPADGIFGFAFLPLATTQPMSAALAFGIGADFDPFGLVAYRPPSDDRADEDIEPVVIESTRPRVEPGTQGSSSFHASYRGMTIPLDAIETPGAELEYPVTESPVALPAGTPIVIQGRFRNAAIFELRHARGTYVEHGSCIVPGALDRISAGDGLSAFFIYAEWADASAGVAFRARVEGSSVVTPSPEVTQSGIDATLFGLVICDG
jgi:hypothetical protein